MQLSDAAKISRIHHVMKKFMNSLIQSSMTWVLLACSTSHTVVKCFLWRGLNLTMIIIQQFLTLETTVRQTVPTPAGKSKYNQKHFKRLFSPATKVKNKKLFHKLQYAGQVIQDPGSGCMTLKFTLEAFLFLFCWRLQATIAATCITHHNLPLNCLWWSGPLGHLFFFSRHFRDT